MDRLERILLPMTPVTYIVNDTGINMADQPILLKRLEEAVSGMRLLHAFRILPGCAAEYTEKRKRAREAADE
jgi:hypothetical protein